MQLGFRERLVLGVTALVFAFAGAAVSALVVLSNRFVGEQVEREVEQCQAGFEQQMQMRMDSWRRETEIFARTPLLLATVAIPDVDAATLADRLAELQAPLVAVLDTDGLVLASRGAWAPGTDLRCRAGVEAALAGRATDHAWPFDGGLALVAVAPLVQGDRLLGLLVRGEPVDNTLTTTIGIIAGRDVLFAHDGVLLAASWHDAMPRTVQASALLDLQHNDLASAGAAVALSIDGEARPGLAVRLHADAGVAWLSHDLQAVYELRDRAFGWLLVTGVVLTLLGAAFAVRTARRLSRPLQRLIDASDRMRQGSLNARVCADGMDLELGRLARSFNAMGDTVQTLVADVTDKASRAEAANRAKDAFLTSMSHELRTPLTGIQSTAELLRQFGSDASPEELADFLDTILRESERLGQRIGSALEFASHAGGRTRWTIGRVSLLESCEQACLRLAGLLQLKQVAFRIDASPDNLLQGDREHVTQAIYHLLHNAWTWSPQGGVVDVKVTVVPEGFVVEVADRGPGIPPHERQRVFDSFTQGGDLMTEKPAGMGIGLKIAAEVAAVHGGAIDYEDRRGGGACFRMRLRAADRPIDRIHLAEAAAT